MIKEISYNGLSNAASDYDAPDGELDIAINTVNDHGDFKALHSPSQICQLDNGCTGVFLHNVKHHKNVITITAVDSASDSLGYFPYDTPTQPITIEAKLPGKFKSITAVGNTLILACEDALFYVLWKDGAYHPLGNKPPFLSLVFGLEQVGTLSDETNVTMDNRYCPWNYQEAYGHGNDIPWLMSAIDKDQDETQLKNITQQVMAQLNKAVADNVTSKGYFYQPFFVRYAYRLFDGSYSWHSAPVLMLPSANVPIIKLEKVDVHITKSILDIPYCELACTSAGADNLSQWSDIIAAIDIFVSPPLYTYMQDRDMKWPEFIKCSDLAKQNAFNTNVGPGGQFFIGNYKATDSSDGYIDQHRTVEPYESREPSPDGRIYYWAIPKNDNLEEQIVNCAEFRLYGTLELDQAKSKGRKSIDLHEKDLTNIYARPSLPDEFRSHSTIAAQFVNSYNSRLNATGVSIKPAAPFPLVSLMSAVSDNQQLAFANAETSVIASIDGQKVISLLSGNPDNRFPYLRYNDQTKSNRCPRFIYHPEPAATDFCLKIYRSFENKPSQQLSLRFNLSKHSKLNGTYHFAGLGVYDATKTPSPITDDELKDRYSLDSSVSFPSKIYTSEVNNPFVFPATGINTVGSGIITGLASATQALSQGQFGQFPLYAFSSDGVWALEVGADGAFTSAHPICRDVCTSPDSIVQLDSSVAFVTAKGLMLINGANASLISPQLDPEKPFFVPNKLSTFSRLLSLVNLDGENFYTYTWRQFLQMNDIVAAFDYPNNQILLCSSCICRDGLDSFAFVYSLSSKTWSVAKFGFISKLNSYPDCLVNSTGALLDISNRTDPLPGIILTRPLKLDAPDTLKTIDTIIQRGNFKKGHIQSVLYASRDLINWSPVWSSKDHFMRGFSGTPYKYFRIALLSRLSDNESVSGATIQFSLRKTNQPR